MKLTKALLCLLSIVGLGMLMSACGGGGGGGGGVLPPATAPTAPPSTTAQQLNTGNSRALFSNMRTAFNSAGQGVAVWEEDSGEGTRVLWAYFDGLTMGKEQELALYGSRPSVATNNTDFMLTWNWGNGLYTVPCSSSGVLDLGHEAMIGDYGGPPDIASSNAGYAVTWSIYDNVSQRNRIFVNIYSASSWTVEKLVDTVPGSGSSDYPRIASNGSGYAITWRKYNSGIGTFDLYGAVSSGNTSTTTWQTALLENLNGNAYPANIASNGSGYAAAWAQSDGSVDRVYANIYSAGTWSTGVTLLETYPYSIYIPDATSAVTIASNNSGYAVAWSQYDGAAFDVFTSLYNAGSWAAPVATARAVNNTLQNPSIASSGSGYAVAWQQDDGTGNGTYDIYASLYSVGTWLTPVLLNTGPASLTRPLAFRFPPSNGYAVGWYQNDASGNPNIYGIIYMSGYGWTSTGPTPLVQRVQSVWPGTSFRPKMVTNRNGVSLAVWPEYHNGNTRLYGSVNGSGVWSAPFLIDGNTGGSFAVATNGGSFMVIWYSNTQGALSATCAGDGTLGAPQKVGPSSLDYPSLASNGSGYAAVWSAWDGAAEGVFSNVYSNGSWSKDAGGSPTPWLIENSAQYAYRPVIASNGSGYAAAWVQNNGGDYRVYANLFTSGTWSTGGTLLEANSSNKDADAASITSNGSGYAVTWYEADGSGNYNRVYANVYSGGTWSTNGILLDNLGGGAAPPSIASNGSGYAVSWAQNDGTASSIYANIYSNGTWSTGGTLLENSPNFYAYNPSIASNGSGYAVAWSQSDGSSNRIYANIYSAGTWSTGGTLLETKNSYADLPMLISNGNKYSVIWWQQDPSDPIVYDVWAKLGF